MLTLNTKAPEFSLNDSEGRTHKLSDYLGQWVLIYFYPKDNTPGCTKEACTFKSEMQRFNELKVKVIGVSADSEESHRKFIAKYGLNFTLLSDQKKDMIRAYEAAGIGTKRISYLIDPQGLIFKSYAKVNPTEHAEEVLNDVKNIYASNSGK